MKFSFNMIRVGRLSIQAMLSAAFISVVPIILISMLVSSQVARKLESIAKEDAEQSLREFKQVTETKIANRKLDLLTMAQSPLMRQVERALHNDGLDPETGLSLASSYDQLAEVFARYLRINQGTLRLCYLNPVGEEVVRVDWRDEHPARATYWQLEEKSWYSYFLEGKKLKNEQCHVAPIRLSVENGIIQSNNPMMRYSTPIWDGNELLGVLAMDTDPARILRNIRSKLDKDDIVLARRDGTYMHHKDADKLWGKQIGSDGNLYRDWPGLENKLSKHRTNDAQGQPLQMLSGDGLTTLTATEVDLGPYNEGWLIGVTQRYEDVLVTANAMQTSINWWAFILGTPAVVFALILTRQWVKPIKQLSSAAMQLRDGDYNARVHSTRHDELGHLAKCFNEMADEVQRVVVIEEDRAKAQAASQAKSEFLANMSHEIRTPMSAILGYAELLQDETNDRETQHDYIQTIRRNGGHLMSIINDILDLSKIEAGKMQIEKVPIDPARLTQDILQLMESRALQKGLTLELVVAENMPTAVLIDPLRIKQILLNLIGNAIKFTASGSVRLDVSVQPSCVPYHAELCFKVIDSGIGIKPEALDQLFKPFSQADNSMSRRFGGTGLGLTLSKRFAEMLDGDITVISEVGKGSTFTLNVRARTIDNVPPKAIKKAHDPTSTAQAQTPKPLTGKVLLAEDGKDNQRLITFHLQKIGLQVDLAENGQEAMDAALEKREIGQPYDLILMDMQMPVLDGYTATRRLREANYAHPIIALTAHAMSGDRERCLEAGCDEYAIKPVDKAKLHALISAALSKNQKNACENAA